MVFLRARYFETMKITKTVAAMVVVVVVRGVCMAQGVGEGLMERRAMVYNREGYTKE